MPKQSKLEAARECMGLSVRRVAEVLELDISGLSRIERGASLPKRETAAAIFDFYGGAIPLGMVYDPTHATYDDWLSKPQKKRLKARGAELVKRWPELAESDRRKTEPRGLVDF